MTGCFSSSTNNAYNELQVLVLPLPDLSYFRLVSLGHHSVLRATRGPDFTVLQVSPRAQVKLSIKS